jgi:PIN domain nuclease of toxin-antitoxin system
MIVLDTQAWLWWTHDLSKLSPRARAAIQQAEKGDGIRVSVISAWEIALKHKIGKLALPVTIDDWYRQASRYPNLVVEPLSALDAIASTRLPGDFHKDPADRMIVAMARRYACKLATSDKLIRSYRHVSSVW